MTNNEENKYLKDILNRLEKIDQDNEQIKKTIPPPNLWGYEYKSSIQLFGLPLIHIAKGFDPVTGRKKIAKGIIAMGDIAVGGFAMGGLAFGLITLGGISISLLASLGGLAISAFMSCGGLSVGTIAIGGLAMGYYGIGGCVVALNGCGGAFYSIKNLLSFINQ